MIPTHLQPFHAPADAQRGHVDLGWNPYPWQQRAIEMIGQPDFRLGVLVCARQIGKTETALRALRDGGLTRPGLYLGVWPMRQTAKNVAWSRLKEICRHIPGVEFREADLQVRFPCPGAKLATEWTTIALFGASDDDSGSSVRGLAKVVGIVADEVSQMPYDFIQSALLPTQVATDRPWALFLGTARGRGDALFEMYEKAASVPGWYRMVVPIDEAGIYDTAQIAAMRPTYTESARSIPAWSPAAFAR